MRREVFSLLKEAITNGDADFGKIDEDTDLDPIRDDPAFAEITKTGHADRRLSTVRTSDPSFESTSIVGVDPTTQLHKCRDLLAEGYRPVSWSVSQSGDQEQLVTASVWHRPVITEETRDRLAERQARASVALVRMGKADEVLPLLQHSADPRLRSFIVNWFYRLGADPKLIAAEFDRLDSPVGAGLPTPPRGLTEGLLRPWRPQSRGGLGSPRGRGRDSAEQMRWTPSSSTPRLRSAGADFVAGHVRYGRIIRR